MDINYLGLFADIYAVWTAHPEGGKEGDYLLIGATAETGVKYRWNKYDQMWQNATNVTETPARDVVTFDKDVNMQNNLTVAGTLRAKRINFEKLDFDETPIKGSEKGITSGAVAEALSGIYTKEETYSKEQLNKLITTPDVTYVTVEATDQTSDEHDVLPATGSADTIYRVANWDGAQYDISCYAEYAWDGSDYVPLAVKDDPNVIYKTSFSASEINDGQYLYLDGQEVKISDNAQFCYTKPIFVCIGSQITIRCAGYQQRLTVIAGYNNGVYTSLVQSIDSNVQDYTYTVLQNMYICLSFKTATLDHLSIANDVVKGIETVAEDLQDAEEDIAKCVKNTTTSVSTSSAVAGTAIRNDGSTLVNNSFSILSNLTLYAGDTLVMTAKGWVGTGVSLAMVSKQMGSTYTCLVAATDSNVGTYTYIAQETMTVALCYNNSETPVITITSDIAAQVNELSEIAGSSEDNADSFTALGNLFPKIAVIGDSLSSGQTENPDPNISIGFGDVYGSSWLSCLARGWNCAARNHYSKAGLKCKDWLDDDGGLRIRFESDIANGKVSNAYFLALGTNDCSKRAQSYNLGSITDVAGTDSFVGYYKQIIELIRTQAPHAVIFCVSLYTTTFQTFIYNDYTDMIEAIAALYDNTFFVDFIGHTEHKNNDNDGVYAIKSHYGTMGYHYVAKVINSLVNDVVKNNAAFFKIFGVYNSDGGQYSL